MILITPDDYLNHFTRCRAFVDRYFLPHLSRGGVHTASSRL
jgi:hypothetical protein